MSDRDTSDRDTSDRDTSDRDTSDRDTLNALLEPVIEQVRAIDPSDPEAVAKLAAALPLDGEAMTRLRALVREGVEARWLADREANGVWFSRVRKATGEGDVSIDCVHMNGPGPGHTHPNGEIDLCFAASGEPEFDGRGAGWIVYPPGSWHVPTVSGGAMDILYFLPGGAIRFEPKPE
jgi:hypothetical protein